MKLEQGDVLICTVERIGGTTVFVEIEGNGQGTIPFSEIAAGRIRNLREYVVPKKTIVCKVLRIKNNHVELSLRRVTPKEKKEVLEANKLERSYKNLLKSILKEKTEEFLKKIEIPLTEFIEDAKTNPKKMEELLGKETSNKILEIIKNQKSKTQIIKREFEFHTQNEKGIEKIKEFLKEKEGIKITYISAGKYLVKAEENSMKEADNKIKAFLERMEEASKKEGFEFKEIK